MMMTFAERRGTVVTVMKGVIVITEIQAVHGSGEVDRGMIGIDTTTGGTTLDIEEVVVAVEVFAAEEAMDEGATNSRSEILVISRYIHSYCGS